MQIEDREQAITCFERRTEKEIGMGKVRLLEAAAYLKQFKQSFIPSFLSKSGLQLFDPLVRLQNNN